MKQLLADYLNIPVEEISSFYYENGAWVTTLISKNAMQYGKIHVLDIEELLGFMYNKILEK